MEFKVDQEECIGCGICESISPEVFKLEGDKAQVILNPVPKNFQSAALEAEDNCPVNAISHK